MRAGGPDGVAALVAALGGSGVMDEAEAVAAFSALAHPVRLAVLRVLVQAMPDGIASGDVAAALSIPASTASGHLAQLDRCGLARGERQGRTVVYTADMARMRALVLYILTDCCDGGAALPPPLDDLDEAAE